MELKSIGTFWLKEILQMILQTQKESTVQVFKNKCGNRKS